MKNRKLTILIVLVVGVWGTIGYKIYDGMGEEDAEYAGVPKVFAADTVHPERYELALSYDDPFLKKSIKAPKPKEQIKVNVKPAIKKVEPAITVDWSRIRYLGSVSNSSRKKVTATIKVGETDYLVKEGDMVEGFLLMEVRRDSVKVGFGKQTTYIKRK